MKNHDENSNNANDQIDENADDDIIELTELVEEESDSEEEGDLDPDAETIIAPPTYYDETVGVSKLLDDDDAPPHTGAETSESNDYDYEETIGIGQLLEDDDDEGVLELDEETIVAPPDFYEQTVGIGKLLDDDSVPPAPEADQEEGMITLDEETVMEQPDLYEQTIGIGKLFESEEDGDDILDLDDETMIAPPDAFDETIGLGALSEETAKSEEEDFDAVVDLDAETIISFTETDDEDIKAPGQPETDEAEDAEEDVIDLEAEGMIADDEGEAETGIAPDEDIIETEENAEMFEERVVDHTPAASDFPDDPPDLSPPIGEDIDTSPLEELDLDEEHLDSDMPIESLDKIPEEDQMTEPIRFPEDAGDAATAVADAGRIEDDETESLDLDDIIEKTTIDKEDIFDLDESAAPIVEKTSELSGIDGESVLESGSIPDAATESPDAMPESFEEPTGAADGVDAALDAPPPGPLDADRSDMDPEEERDILDLLDMDLEGAADAETVAEDTEIPPDLESEPHPVTTPAESPYAAATTEEESAETLAAFDGVSPEAFEAALERVIKKVFEEKIESVLFNAVEKVVSREIQKLKDVLITNASMDE